VEPYDQNKTYDIRKRGDCARQAQIYGKACCNGDQGEKRKHEKQKASAPTVNKKRKMEGPKIPKKPPT